MTAPGPLGPWAACYRACMVRRIVESRVIRPGEAVEDPSWRPYRDNAEWLETRGGQ